MNLGDMIRLNSGPVYHFDLTNPAAVLVAKVPRSDYLEYDWIAVASGRFIKLGRQIEISCQVASSA